MSKFAVGERVDNAADDHESGTVIAVFPTVDDSFRYAVDMEGYGALQFFAEQRLVIHPCYGPSSHSGAARAWLQAHRAGCSRELAPSSSAALTEARAQDL
jgi:hypothetical protein